MKQITIQDAVVQEIIIRPNDENVPISVRYKLYDDAGREVSTRSEDIPLTSFSVEAMASLTDLITKLTSGVADKELTDKAPDSAAISVV